MSKEGTTIKLFPNIGEDVVKRFEKQFVKNKTNEAELLWIRSQREVNKKNSNCQNPEKDRRRRIVNGLDRYAITESNKGLSLSNIDPYLWEQVILPEDEVFRYKVNLEKFLETSKWSKRVDNDQYTYKNFILGLKNEKNKNDKSDFPHNYTTLEIEIKANGRKVNKIKESNRLSTVGKGIRLRDKRGNPEILTDFKKLKKYFPMQVELGCGPSVEAKIDPLHYFHALYQVQNPRTGRFNLGGNENTLIFDVIDNPEEFFKKTGKLYPQSLLAKPTPFYFLLEKLTSKSIVRGKIINNNFDGLCDYLSLPAIYIRHFEKENYFPKIIFDSQVKSLLVVGSHADRRRIQKQARSKGLKVIHVDPEGFYERDKFKQYQIEAPKDEDLLIRMTANDFTKKFNESFGSISN
jgi:hypothetical protein